MPSPTPPRPGAIVWRDLTVKDAPRLRDFYRSVVGWKATPHDMGGYADFEMKIPSTGETVTGICHSRGVNAKLPPQWIVYVQVKDVAKSARKAEASGGALIDGPREMGNALFCVIRDPAGAVCGLIGPAPKRRRERTAPAEAAGDRRSRSARRTSRPAPRRRRAAPRRGANRPGRRS
jgi:predicted enzyme related to lactoylglutathione lyase